MFNLSKLLATFAVICTFLFTGSSAQVPYIPCPSIFEYGFDGNSYYGIVTLRGLSYGVTTLMVQLSQPGALNTDYSGKLSLNFNKDKIFDYIRLGRPVTYRVDFPLRNVIPRITEIAVNNNRLCSGPKDPPPSATISLEHTITAYSGSQSQQLVDQSPIQTSPNFPVIRPSYTDYIPGGSNFDFANFFGPTYTQTEQHSPQHQHTVQYPQRPQRPQRPHVVEYQNPFIPSMRTTVPARITYVMPSTTKAPIQTQTQPPVVRYRPTPTIPSTSAGASDASEFMGGPASFTYLNRVCGTENSDTDVQSLAIHGEVIAKSRFPWIVAIYTRKTGSLNFQCGGSLISTRTVISAAHCFHQGTEEILAQNLLLSIGRHNLNDWQNAENIEADKLILHPDYKPEENFDADIAIITLKRTVRFKPNIRPVCLWQGPIEVNNIEGTTGIVVGWGVDETNTGISSVPKLVNTTIVSELTCIRSNERFYYLTSNRTLCAGNRDGSGPCMGDSGSGLMIKNGNKWMLRGSVSASLASPTRSCNLDEFVVYCDIAKFLEWIRSNMFL